MAVLIDAPRPLRRGLVLLLRLTPGAILTLFAAIPVVGAPSYSEDSVKAAYLYRFTQYIEWPDAAPSGIPFTIAVLDAPNVAAELRRILPNHRIKNSAAQVREIARLQDLGSAQMLYIGSAQIDRVRSVVAALANRPVLVVTDAERGLAAGSILNFVMLEHRVRFEVSLAAADRSRLRISAELLGVATRVEPPDHQSGIAKTLNDMVGE
jgi:YfiR/HmsC-like